MTSAEDPLLQRISAVPVTREDLIEFAQAMAAQPDPAARAYEARTIWLVQRHRGQPDKACALEFRMQALARVFEDGRIEGWTLPGDADRGIPTHHAVLAAAAMEPLVLIDGRPGFERHSFMARVLQFAPALGSG
ncbi:MAG: hypothetical protein IT532_13440 [Burkholderiales bacterium]|nr:hypothetical protein [Burkholderiales bacterium]